MAFVDWREAHRSEVAVALSTMSPSAVTDWYGAHKVPSHVTVADVDGGEAFFWKLDSEDVEMALDGGEPVHVQYMLTGWLLHSQQSPRRLEVSDVVDGLANLGVEWSVMYQTYALNDTPGVFNDMQFNQLNLQMHRSQ